MIQRLKITNSKDTPFYYVSELPALADGTEYVFTNRVNIVVGENGCGKTTLLNLLRTYLMVYQDECGRGMYNCALHKVYDWVNNRMYGGADVYADYRLNTFSMFAAEDREPSVTMESFERFGQAYELNKSSKGQKTVYALFTLFNKMYSKETNLKFDYEAVLKEWDCPEYVDYIKSHRVAENENTWTVLMDEPDNSVDMERIMELYGIFSEPKDDTQIIAVIHNPFLIAKLSSVKSVNMIEMSDGYVAKINNFVNQFNKL